MNTILRYSIVAAAALGIATGANAGAKAKVGQSAPDFTLPSVTGDQVSLSDYSGKVVVLEWVNHGCPFVKKHYDSGNMPSLQEKYTGQDVVWLTICSSAEGEQGYHSAEEWQKVAKKKNMQSTAILLDTAGKVGRMYDAKVTPHMYVIDENGTLVYNGGIDSIASTNKSDIAKADPYVAAALESVMAGQPVENSATRAYGCNVKYARDS